MKDENIKEILDKFDKVLENYELDKKWGQMSVDSICHLFPSEMVAIKDYITNLQTIEQQYSAILSENAELENKITNLQEENKRLYKELEKADSITQSCIFEGSRSAGKSYRQCLNWLENYKSRNEKATEYINNKWKKDKHYEDIENCMTFCLYDKDDLLNILQGSDENE